MTTENDMLWQTKLHARLHDPAEKALVLLRDPAGHEGGSSRALHRLLGFQRIEVANIDPDNDEVLHRTLFSNGIPAEIYATVKRADWWAAAADRPQWPMEEVSVTTSAGAQRTFAVAGYAQVRWTKQPVLIHPLTGVQFPLGNLSDTDLDDLKSRCFDHTSRLIHREDGQVDWRRTLLAIWRFGPELREQDDDGKLGALWPLLPADTRIPDHSIWDHLDLTSAFAGAFAADPQGDVALLTLSIGPVQSFIAAARNTSDLWAGSHLLARLSWESMKPVCEALGPDAILFPRLRGVPQVDAWLRDEQRLTPTLFDELDWTRRATDANPLFAAALPNRFVALVPASQARDLALTVEQAVRNWLQSLGTQVVERLLAESGLAADDSHAHKQMREQLAGFPEVHWAAVPFSLIRPRNAERQTDLDVSALTAAMSPFFGVKAGQSAGFLSSPAWDVLRKEARWNTNTVFFAPNPGALYPAVHDLAERALAAAKSVRPFAQRLDAGWRCSLTGETEWLTTDPRQLSIPPGQRADTLWTRIARNRPAWAKKGEHLGALPAIKRLWPTLFAEEVGRLTGGGDADGRSARRFVVSTHTMALAHQLDQWLKHGGHVAPGLGQALDERRGGVVALPRKLMCNYAQRPDALDDARRLLALLDAAADDDEESQTRRLQALVRDTLGRDAGRLETYYGLLLMDGDRMGAWLAGGDEYAIRYRDSFHPQVRTGFDQHAQREPALNAYGQQKRAVSPNRHLSISAALNDFSLTVVPHVVESEFLGRLIYAGGDDVLAMLPVADLLPAMQRLRLAYSGHDPDHPEGERDKQGLSLRQGFATLRQGKRLRLMRMMGERATASAGAVVAHHQAPLGAVMRELRAAEARAKSEGGRDAFTLTVVKRSGGALSITAKWGEPAALLNDLRSFLGTDGVSRRAVYNSLDWMKDLPQDDEAMLASLLGYQLARQARGDAEKQAAPLLAQRLARATFDDSERPRPQVGVKRLDWLYHFMGVAEFLARETRGTD